MRRIIERCAGIDIGKGFLLCCVLTGGPKRSPVAKHGALTRLFPV